MNNKEVAHLWANRSRESAKGSSFYFEGDTVYSYGSHFPVARHYKGVVLFTSKWYSNTTARHKSITRSACSHLTVFTVANPRQDPGKADVKEYSERVTWLKQSAARARNPQQALEALERQIAEANSFCQTFGFKTRFSMPEDGELAVLKERAKQSAAREQKARAVKLARQEREAAETVSKWLAGERVTIPHIIQTVYLRVHRQDMSGEEFCNVAAELETSKGAKVPLSEAEKAFRFAVIARAKGWHKNGEQFKVGDYQLDAVNEFGVIAGCHRIAWAEVERFAKAQGWL